MQLSKIESIIFFAKIKFTSYVNYCLKLSQENICIFFLKIKFTSAVNYCLPTKYIFFTKLNSLVM